jgi:prolyl-tRNA synthetase
MLNDIHDNLFTEAKDFMKSNTIKTDSYEEFKKIVNKGGFIRCGWDGTSETELKIKEETGATTRVIPFDENPKNLICIYTGKPAKHEVIFAKAY